MEVVMQESMKRSYQATLQLLVFSARDNYKCNRGPRPSGAALVTKLGTVVEGHVESIKDTPSCLDDGCMMEDGHCVRNIHAEVDAILKCAYMGIPTVSGTMFTINKPCFNCMKACAKAGISTIVYAYAVYDEERTNLVAKAAKMELVHVPID